MLPPASSLVTPHGRFCNTHHVACGMLLAFALRAERAWRMPSNLVAVGIASVALLAQARVQAVFRDQHGQKSLSSGVVVLRGLGAVSWPPRSHRRNMDSNHPHGQQLLRSPL